MHRKGPEKTAGLNRLAREKSPYLLQHAENPVQWYPWGEEAFNKAREEDKPIFLSIGYSTCHWCHVMAQESFAAEKVKKAWIVDLKKGNQQLKTHLEPEEADACMAKGFHLQSGRGTLVSSFTAGSSRGNGEQCFL